MDASGLTVGHLARAYRARFGSPKSGRGKVLDRMARCGTEALGTRMLACNACGHLEKVWNSCLDRHCPSCRGGSAKAWVERLEATLLPVPYFHLVFTLPRAIGDVALYNKELVYGLLMRVSAEVLSTIAADERFLGGKAGFVSVLHTWSQTLEHHPHVHMVAPGGVITPKGRWRCSKENFFVPVLVLSKLFRRRFLEELEALRKAGKLTFRDRVEELASDAAWHEMMEKQRRSRWVVYAKRPFGGPQQVLRYLGRYTHRVAISNGRLLGFDGEDVAFGVRASEATGHREVLRLPLRTFMDRFLLHVLPRGFVRIRYYGFLCHGHRRISLELIRKQLGPHALLLLKASEPSPRICPACGWGELEEVLVGSLVEARALLKEAHLATTGPPGKPGCERRAA